MLVNCQGIVFKSYKFQDTSLIVKIFTSSHGVQTFMVKGIRSVKANGKASLFQPGVLLDMIMYYQENKNFKGLREYRASHLYSSSLFDIRKSSVLIFLMEIIELCIHGEESNDAMFDFVYSALVKLDKEEFRAVFHIEFLLEFMQHLGIYPNGHARDLNPYFSIKEGGFVNHKSSFPYEINTEDSASFSKALEGRAEAMLKKERKVVMDIILRYFSYHLDNFGEIKSLKVLESVLS